MTQEMTQLTAEQKVALSGCVSGVAGVKKTLDVGEYPVNMLVRVGARVVKIADETKPHPVELPMKTLVLALLSNMTPNQRRKMLRDLAEGTMTVHGYTAKNLEADWEELAGTTVKTFSGKTYVRDAVVELVEEPGLVEAGAVASNPDTAEVTPELS